MVWHKVGATADACTSNSGSGLSCPTEGGHGVHRCVCLFLCTCHSVAAACMTACMTPVALLVGYYRPQLAADCQKV